MDGWMIDGPRKVQDPVRGRMGELWVGTKIRGGGKLEQRGASREALVAAIEKFERQRANRKTLAPAPVIETENGAYYEKWGNGKSEAS